MLEIEDWNINIKLNSASPLYFILKNEFNVSQQISI